MRWCVLVLLGLVNVGQCLNCRGEKPKHRECDKVCDANGNCKIRAALLLPGNTTYDACLSAVGPALDLAMQDPVIRNAFPPWLTVEWMKYDVTDCDAAYAVISAIDAYNDCAHVFFGPSCDFALASVARIAKFLGGTGTPLVTTGGFTFDFVKPKQNCKDEFYMLVRAGPLGFEDLAYFLIDLMRHFEWKQLLLINEPESQLHVAGKSTCHLMMKSFANFLKKEEILYTPWDTTSDAGLNYTENLKFYLGYKYTNSLQCRSSNLHCKRAIRGLKKLLKPFCKMAMMMNDLAIIPPDLSTLTNEEEGADEDMAACFIPQDVPGTIEVFMNREDNGSEDSEYDDSDNEPLESKRRRPDFIGKVER